jgi:hypothetical protein
MIELLRRTPLDSGPITDEEIGTAGTALCAMLERDENAADSR